MRVITGVLALAAVCLGVSGCRRGAQGGERRVPDAGLTRGDATTPTGGVRPGIHPQVVLGPIRNPYAGDASAIASGRQLFVGMNCAGCHSGYGGGAIGPSLRDSLWIYGNEDAQIFSSIAEGRPNGMPAWGGRLPDDVIWRLVAYIRTLGTRDEPQKPPQASEAKVREAPGPREAPG